MKRLPILLLALLPMLTLTVPLQAEEEAKVKDIKIIIKTGVGEIEATIFASKVPVTAANFLNLAARDYYDGLTFHRVISDFMVQGGDPSGTGSGGPGYRFEDEIESSLRHTKPGIFSMANAGPATNGSQFFITHGPTPHLDGKHAVFGEVTKGQDVVDKIARGEKIKDIEIIDPTKELFKAQAKRLLEWNAILDRRYPKAKKEEAAGEKEAATEKAAATESATEKKAAEKEAK